jgi:hypothetical protein
MNSNITIDFIKDTQDNIDDVKHLLGDGLYVSICQIMRHVFLNVEHQCPCNDCSWRTVSNLCDMLDNLPTEIYQTVVCKNLVHVQLLNGVNVSVCISFDYNPSFWKNQLEELSMISRWSINEGTS